MKLLIIRFSSIGDIILTSPVIRIAKQQLNAEVHYITKSQNKLLLAHNPYIDKIYSIDKNINEVLPELKKENYDYIIDLHNSLRSKILKSKLNVKSFSVNKKNWDKWLLVNLKKKLDIPHIVDRYVDTLKKLGGENDGKGLDFFYTKDNNLFKEYNIPQSYICISLGAKHFTKKIPADKIIELISKSNMEFVLIGGKDVIEEAKKIVNSTHKSIINLVGKITIDQSAQIIESSDKILTSDTGMMHIAAALKKETIVIWGNTVPEFGMYPYYGNLDITTTNFEVKDLSCRPCSKIGFSKCPKAHFNCMNNQSVEDILAVL